MNQKVIIGSFAVFVIVIAFILLNSFGMPLKTASGLIVGHDFKPPWTEYSSTKHGTDIEHRATYMIHVKTANKEGTWSCPPTAWDGLKDGQAVRITYSERRFTSGIWVRYVEKIQEPATSP